MCHSRRRLVTGRPGARPRARTVGHHEGRGDRRDVAVPGSGRRPRQSAAISVAGGQRPGQSAARAAMQQLRTCRSRRLTLQVATCSCDDVPDRARRYWPFVLGGQLRGDLAHLRRAGSVADIHALPPHRLVTVAVAGLHPILRAAFGRRSCLTRQRPEQFVAEPAQRSARGGEGGEALHLACTHSGRLLPRHGTLSRQGGAKRVCRAFPRGSLARRADQPRVGRRWQCGQ